MCGILLPRGFYIPHSNNQQKGEPMSFGEFVKNKRLEVDLSLRKFCDIAGLDPSNWSKVERDRMPLALETDKLLEIAELLNLTKGQADWVKFFDLAAVAKKRIPEYVYSNESVLEALPIFFRTASNEKPSDEELDKLIELIKRR